MRSVFTRLSKPELDFLTDNINFNDIELEILSLSAKGYTEIQVGERVGLSSSMINKRRNSVKRKIKDFLEVAENMTTLYVNGKRVSKEQISKMEIKVDEVKRIIAEKLFTDKEDERLTKTK